MEWLDIRCVLALHHHSVSRAACVCWQLTLLRAHTPRAQAMPALTRVRLSPSADAEALLRGLHEDQAHSWSFEEAHFLVALARACPRVRLDLVDSKLGLPIRCPRRMTAAILRAPPTPATLRCQELQPWW